MNFLQMSGKDFQEVLANNPREVVKQELIKQIGELDSTLARNGGPFAMQTAARNKRLLKSMLEELDLHQSE